MASEADLQVDYLPLASRAAAPWDDVLGVAAFGAGEPGALVAALAEAAVPMAAVRTPVLGSTAGGVCEVWRTRQPLEPGRRGRVQYRRGEELLFGCISLPEQARVRQDSGGQHGVGPDGMSALHVATHEAYREIFATLDELAYPHLLRIWNYLPQINLEADGSERYWQFNKARRLALVASNRDTTTNVPAACALGSADGSPLVAYFLASRVAPALIENPRQVSAYEYPAQYGPKPAFSRASVLREAHGAVLFISGTASIVGHQTVHIGDVAAQTRETLVNIEAVLGEANRVSGTSRFSLENLAFKVYVRNSSDLPVVQSQLRRALGARARAVYLQADICREDLLVEIEAAGRTDPCD